ncbi:MAG: hypothetical protein GF311_17745 [Candidatus Lokiarchaeota archaeon]|nr:hypothetical protein [Candidatus Lokiarchaeota archaeon]
MGFNMYKKIDEKGFKDINPKILAWHRVDEGTKTSILYIYPQPGDDFKKKKYFAVKDYERALFYDKGELIGILEGGIYELNKKTKTKGTEIVWVDTSINEIKWGIPLSNGIPSKDGIIVGLHGTMKFRVNDVKTFYTDVIAGRKIWSLDDVKNWILSLLQTVLRDTFKNYTAKQILLEDRERVLNVVNSKIMEDFLKYGMEFESLNLLGIQVPEGVDSLYETDKQKSKISEEIKILKLKKDLETKKRELKAAKKSFEREQEILEAKKERDKMTYLSERDKLEGLTKSEIIEQQGKASVAGDLAKMKLESEKEVKIAEFQTNHPLKNKKRIENRILKLKQKLNQFDELLSSGKISEETYSLRVRRIEKEINELEEKLLNF